jgi:hypothetical protein
MVMMRFLHLQQNLEKIIKGIRHAGFKNKAIFIHSLSLENILQIRENLKVKCRVLEQKCRPRAMI